MARDAVRDAARKAAREKYEEAEALAMAKAAMKATKKWVNDQAAWRDRYTDEVKEAQYPKSPKEMQARKKPRI